MTTVASRYRKETRRGMAMKITLELEEREIETIMSALEAQAAKATLEAREGKRNLDAAIAHTKRLNGIRSKLYGKVLKAHGF